MLTAVARVDVLQHPLALAVREVDVDVRRLGALLAEESLEEELELDRVHRRDAEAVADRAVRRRAASLAEDPLAPREAHDVPHDQEVAREPELGDERELVEDLLVVPRGALPSPAFLCARLHQPFEVLVLAHPLRQREVRQPGLERLQPEGASVGDGHRVRETLFESAPARGELRMALEVPFAVGAEPRAHLVERRAMAQRREHVVRDAAARPGVVHVVGHHPRQALRPGERDEPLHEGVLLGERMVPALHGEALAEGIGEGAEGGPCETVRLVAREQGARACRAPVRGPAGRAPFPQREQLRHPATRAAGECEQSRGVLHELVERHARFAARVVESCPRDERAEVPPSFARFGEHDEMRAQPRNAVLAGHAAREGGEGVVRIGRVAPCGALELPRQRHVHRELRALDRGEPRRARRGGEAHRAADVVMVGEREGVQAERHGPLHEALGIGGAVEEREGGVTVEFGEGGHADGSGA